MKNKKLAIKLSKIFLVGVVIVLAALFGINHFHQRPSRTFQQTPTKGGASVYTNKGQPPASSSTDNSQPGDTKTNPGSGATASLIAPSGDFVSNHRPSLSGTSGSSNETSVCTTTPGATCVITFTQNGTKKSLNSQTTDQSGNTYWNWRLGDVGLTSGTWKITATASLNGSTLSASDALELQISP